MSNPQITISNVPSTTEGLTIISNETINEDITFTYEDADGNVTSMFDLTEAQINIFDSEYYINSNPDIAGEITSEYANASTAINLTNANVPRLSPLGSIQIQAGGDISNSSFSGQDFFSVQDSFSVRDYSAAVKDYFETGAAQGRDPSPLFDREYYLEQNPDVASALAGGSFNGDPLLHYVEAGATEGRDPNPYFDTDYYVAQNPGVVETGLNPLEHYVLLGSSQGADPSANFDPQFYLAQNQDVAAARIDPLTHFLSFGQDEGRSPMA